MALIELQNLSIKYVGRKDPALVNVNLNFEQGETVLLLGASGCGKSTLALALNGLIPHSFGGDVNGHVVVDGLDTQQHSVAELARKLGIVFQDPEAQFVTLKVEDEIVFGLENLCLPPEGMSDKVTAALADVKMSGARQRAVHRLSGGEKQRIALASLLAMEPSVLVFDEPTANLDPVGTQDVFALLAELKTSARHTIILIEHKLDELMHLIDRVVVLGRQGALLADGNPRNVFREQGDVLREHGVWMPQVTLLAERLRLDELAADAFPITIVEAEQVIAERFTAQSNSKTDDLFAAPIAASELAIEVRGLSAGYGAQPVLNDIKLQVGRGDFLAIVGANGAGKTTLAQHFMDILHPPNGTVLLDGRDVMRYSPSELIRKVGFVFQNPEHQFVANTVADEIRFGLKVLGLAADEIETRTQAMLERFGLARYARANPFTLSHGEKRRLSVATMLAVGQDILILDEPTFGQDQRNAESLMSLLRELHAEGRTVIVITHDMALVAEHALNVAVMAGGRLLFHGPTREAFAQPDLLAEARLTLPPLARLSTQLANHDPAWGGLLTVDDFAAVYATRQPAEMEVTL